MFDFPITCRLIQYLIIRPVFLSHAPVIFKASSWDSAQLWRHMLMPVELKASVSNGELQIGAVCVLQHLQHDILSLSRGNLVCLKP